MNKQAVPVIILDLNHGPPVVLKRPPVQAPDSVASRVRTSHEASKSKRCASSFTQHAPDRARVLWVCEGGQAAQCRGDVHRLGGYLGRDKLLHLQVVEGRGKGGVRGLLPLRAHQHTRAVNSRRIPQITLQSAFAVACSIYNSSGGTHNVQTTVTPDVYARDCVPVPKTGPMAAHLCLAHHGLWLFGRRWWDERGRARVGGAELDEHALVLAPLHSPHPGEHTPPQCRAAPAQQRARGGERR